MRARLAPLLFVDVDKAEGAGPAVGDGLAQGPHAADAGRWPAPAQLRGSAEASGRADGGGIGGGGGAGAGGGGGECPDAVAKTGVQIAEGAAASGAAGGTADRWRGGNLVTRAMFLWAKSSSDRLWEIFAQEIQVTRLKALIASAWPWRARGNP